MSVWCGDFGSGFFYDQQTGRVSALESMAARTASVDVSPAERDAVLAYFSALLNERRFAVPPAGDC